MACRSSGNGEPLILDDTIISEPFAIATKSPATGTISLWDMASDRTEVHALDHTPAARDVRRGAGSGRE